MKDRLHPEQNSEYRSHVECREVRILMRPNKILMSCNQQNGVTPDSATTAAIKEIEDPTNSTELCRFVGTVNQLEKFSPRLAELSSLLKELLSTKQAWLWDTRQEEAFTNIKTELTNPTILALYNPQT